MNVLLNLNIYFDHSYWLADRKFLARSFHQSSILNSYYKYLYSKNKPIKDNYIQSGPQKLVNNLIKAYRDNSDVVFNQPIFNNYYFCTYLDKHKEFLKIIDNHGAKFNTEIRCEGHTDDAKLPPSADYPSNWELSAARSLNVVRLMNQYAGMPEKYFSALGYGEHRPVIDVSRISNFKDKKNRIILSYNWKLRSIASYIQQLEMESLGKQSNPISLFEETGQSIFGGFGSTAQHSYFQLLHQGTAQFCADIIYHPAKHSSLSSAQAIAQAKLLALRNKFSSDPKESTNSNSPVNLFMLQNMKLSSLGFLLASWEHRVFITASMLQINPFDQFGVNAGKIAAKSVLDSI